MGGGGIRTDEWPYLHGMVLTRFISAAVETTGALLMLRSGRVATALRINGILGLVGPAILVLVTALGVAGLAGRLPPVRTALIVLGVCLILAGTR